MSIPSELGSFNMSDALKKASRFGYSIPVEASYRDYTNGSCVHSVYHNRKPKLFSRNYEKLLNGELLPDGVFFDPLNNHVIVEFSTWDGSLLETEATWFFAYGDAK